MLHKSQFTVKGVISKCLTFSSVRSDAALHTAIFFNKGEMISKPNIYYITQFNGSPTSIPN